MENLIKLINKLIPNGVVQVNKKGNGVNITNLSSSLDSIKDVVSQLNKEIATLGINREAKFFDEDTRKTVDDNDKITTTVLPAKVAIYIPKPRTSDSDTDLLSALSK